MDGTQANHWSVNHWRLRDARGIGASMVEQSPLCESPVSCVRLCDYFPRQAAVPHLEIFKNDSHAASWDKHSEELETGKRIALGKEALAFSLSKIRS